MAKPLQTFKGIAIWPNNRGGVKCQVKKSYKDKASGQWKYTDVFYPSEIQGLIEALNNALNWIKVNSPESFDDTRKANTVSDGPKREESAADDPPFNPDVY